MNLRSPYPIGFLLYGLLVAVGMGVAGWLSNKGPHAMLAHEVAENHFIEDADLVPVDEPKIVHQYAKRHMRIGETITPDDVGDQKSAVEKSTLALLASYAPATRKRPLEPGDKVRLCLDGLPVQLDAVTVVIVECDATACAATLPLPDIPKALQDKEALARLRLVDGADNCGGK